MKEHFFCVEKKMGEENEVVKIFVNQKKNLIYFNAPIENEYILELIEHLHKMEQNELERVNELVFEMKKKTGSEFQEKDFVKPILLEINSNGGLIHEAFVLALKLEQVHQIHCFRQILDGGGFTRKTDFHSLAYGGQKPQELPLSS